MCTGGTFTNRERYVCVCVRACVRACVYACVCSCSMLLVMLCHVAHRLLKPMMEILMRCSCSMVHHLLRTLWRVVLTRGTPVQQGCLVQVGAFSMHLCVDVCDVAHGPLCFCDRDLLCGRLVQEQPVCVWHQRQGLFTAF